MSNSAILIIQWADPDYPAVGNMNLHKVSFLGRKGRLVYHTIFWPDDPASYIEARMEVDAWAQANEYEIVDVKDYLDGVDLGNL